MGRPLVERISRPANPRAYAYVLGMYLGDGHLNATARSFQLRITLDMAYPDIVRECEDAIGRVLPGATVRVREPAGRGAYIVESASVSWPLLLPQHGAGRKHERDLRLEPWQHEIVERSPERFLRGLIHSDGCRCVNRFQTTLPSGRVAQYAYPRYFFTNRSEDVKALFGAACDRLGIRWTRSSAMSLSVSHRASVALLDGFVGPKR